MKKVFQTIVDKKHGNCMQAAVASLLELELEQVPNFISYGEDWGKVWWNFWDEKGYSYYPTTIVKSKRGTEELKNVAKFDKGINGYFYATVNSQTYSDGTHAIIVDENLNVVHDPNPNQLALKLTPDDILSIMVMSDMIIGKTGKCFTKEDWDNATEEERDLNTYKVGE
jgi:hypothetical protein